MIGLLIFAVALAFLLLGYPVAFTFAAIGIAFVVIFAEPSQLAQIPYRIYSNMGDNGEGIVLMAIPLFIFMGLILQRSNLADQLLQSMGKLFGSVRGGLAISTVLVGSVLAASTGVVGASVVAMGLISLPVMLRHNYRTELATGSIAAAGTLGQIIPPSIVLIILGDVLNIPVGDLFSAALLPGLTLVGCYVLYILIYCRFYPDSAPPVLLQPDESRADIVISALLAIVPPLALILFVLGSIFTGIATPTESSALGCLGAILLSALYKSFSLKMCWESARETVKITAMVFAVLLGASLFSMGFSYSGGEEEIEKLLLSLPGGEWSFLCIILLVIILLGFFLDYIEISYIVLPLVYPVVETLGINMTWFAILVAMNLQTSFLTPPFGFALFYLKGVVPPSVSTMSIYRGVLPFIFVQVLVLLAILIFPELFNLERKAVALW